MFGANWTHRPPTCSHMMITMPTLIRLINDEKIEVSQSIQEAHEILRVAQTQQTLAMFTFQYDMGNPSNEVGVNPSAVSYLTESAS